MVSAEPDEATGQLEHGEIVLTLLLPADQNPAAHRQPRQRALYYPAAWSEPLRTRWPQVANQREVRLIPVLDWWSLQHDGVDGCLQQLRVGHIGAGHRDAQRSAVSLHDE